MKRLRLTCIVLGAGAVIFGLTSVLLWVQRNDYKQSLQLEKEANAVLYANAGRMCSVVSSSEASSLLESEVIVDAASFPAGFTSAIQDSNLYPLIDSCRYSGLKNNTRYINLVGQRYTTIDQAKEDYNLQRTRLLDTEPLDAQKYQVDEAFYYGGAIYVRRSDTIFSYSVNKPEVAGSDLQAFTESNFEQIYRDALDLL